jgi:hypothetical protein
MELPGSSSSSRSKSWKPCGDADAYESLLRLHVAA